MLKTIIDIEKIKAKLHELLKDLNKEVYIFELLDGDSQILKRIRIKKTYHRLIECFLDRKTEILKKSKNRFVQDYVVQDCKRMHDFIKTNINEFLVTGDISYQTNIDLWDKEWGFTPHYLKRYLEPELLDELYANEREFHYGGSGEIFDKTVSNTIFILLESQIGTCKLKIKVCGHEQNNEYSLFVCDLGKEGWMRDIELSNDKLEFFLEMIVTKIQVGNIGNEYLYYDGEVCKSAPYNS